MGDRGNVYITDTSETEYIADQFERGARGIYLYSHWSGYDLPAQVRDALKAGKGRWGDGSYLTRILIDQITKDGRDEETGFGVGLSLGDNSHPITVVDLGRQQVAFAIAGQEREPAKWYAANGRQGERTDFSLYCSLTEPGYPQILQRH